jgi:hypothetical protein
VRRPALVLVALLVAAATPVGAQAASVRVMVAGKARVLHPADTVRLAARSVRVGGRRCAVGARTPLAALLATGMRVGLRDYYGSCGRSPRDAGGLFVTRVGPEVNRGRDGWVYKVGHRTGTAGAADPRGPFGRGALRGGSDVLWFWCVLDRAEACQRTLDVRAPGRVARGASLRVAVRGYDDAGRGRPVPGATVRLGRARATTGAGGTAVLRAPRARGRVTLRAQGAGMVAALPRRVAVR